MTNCRVACWRCPWRAQSHLQSPISPSASPCPQPAQLLRWDTGKEHHPADADDMAGRMSNTGAGRRHRSDCASKNAAS